MITQPLNLVQGKGDALVLRQYLHRFEQHAGILPLIQFNARMHKIGRIGQGRISVTEETGDQSRSLLPALLSQKLRYNQVVNADSPLN